MAKINIQKKKLAATTKTRNNNNSSSATSNDVDAAMITPLPTVSEIAEDASVDPTQESAVESPSSDGDRSLPLRNKAVPVLTSTGYDDDDVGDMDVDEDCIPSRLPSFKKRTAINADESVPGYDASIDESLTEEDTDNESELEMARSTLENMRLNLKRMDKNILRLQSRAARDCGIPNAQLTQELSDFKMQRSITFGSYGELKQAYENLAESMTPLKPRIVAKESTVYEASDDYQSLPIRRNQKSFIGGLPIKLQSNWPRYNGKADETAYEFFDKFIRQVRPILGEEIFRQYGHTYLSLLVSDNNFQDQLQTAFDKLEGNVITRDIMERTFLDVCLTKEQREKSVAKVTKIGRHKGESYRLFATRIARIVKQYRIQEDNGVILTLLRQAIPAKDMTNVNLHYLYTNQGTTRDTPETIDDFCTALGKIVGPDDARDDFELPSSSLRDQGDVKAQSRNGRNSKEKAGSMSYCTKCKDYRHHSSEEHIECEHCGRAGHQKHTCRKLDNQRGPSRNNGRSDRGRDSYSRYNSRDNNRDHSVRDSSNRDNNGRHHPYNRDGYRPRNDRSPHGDKDK